MAQRQLRCDNGTKVRLLLYASHSTQPTTMEFDPYQVLDIPANTTDASIITKAYRKKALQLHPDKTTLPAEQAATLFQQVQQARAFLLDDEFQQQRQDFAQKAQASERERQRQAGLSRQKRRMHDDLERYERAYAEQTTKRRKAKTPSHDLHQESQGLKAKYAAQASQQDQQEQDRRQAALERRQVRLKWSRKKLSPTVASLEDEMSTFGKVQSVEMVDDKKALVTFSHASSVPPCVEHYAESSVLRAHYVGIRRDEERQKVYTTPTTSEKPISPTTTTTRRSPVTFPPPWPSEMDAALSPLAKLQHTEAASNLWNDEQLQAMRIVE